MSARRRKRREKTKPSRFSPVLKVILDDLYTRFPDEAKRIDTALVTHALVELLANDRRNVLLEAAGIVDADSEVAYHSLFALIATMTGEEASTVSRWLRGEDIEENDDT